MSPNRNRDINDISQWADEPMIGSRMVFDGYEVVNEDSYDYHWNTEFIGTEGSLPIAIHYSWDCVFITVHNNFSDTSIFVYGCTISQENTQDQYIYSGDPIVFDMILKTPVKSGTDMWGQWNKYKIKDTDCSYDTPAGHFDGLVRMDIMVYSELIGTLYYSPQLSHIVYFSLDASQFEEWKRYFEITKLNN